MSIADIAELPIETPALQAEAVLLEVPRQRVFIPSQITQNLIDLIPPNLLRVLMCESGVRHFDKRGNVLKSHTNDIGIMQINVRAHVTRAKQLGYNLWDMSDNIRFGLLLYREQGLRPWVCARKLGMV